jgi:leucyl aminopeptidase
MTHLTFTFSDATLSDFGPVALGVFDDSGKPAALNHNAFTSEQLAGIGASGKAESVTRSLGLDGASYLLVGVGKDSTPSIDDWRAIGGAIARAAGADSSVQVSFGEIEKATLLAIAEGIALGNYRVKTQKHDAKPASLTKVHFVTNHEVVVADVHRIQALAKAVHTTRDLAVTPANLLYPELFADLAVEAGANTGVEVKVWDEHELAAQGFGAIVAVGQGSARKPRLVKVSYKPANAKLHAAVVGKGITFDTGGYNIKPLAGMYGMKYDMTGAATAYAAVLAAAELQLPVRVTAWLCLAENMVSSTATRPGDVIKARNGKTIEVVNPDAEGRLVLADGLSAASEEQPDLIIDVATLTGAARIALGTRYAALMGTPQGVAIAEVAAEQAGELVWNMPFPKEIRKSIESDVADLANAKIGANGGTLLAGHFLREFIGQKPDGTSLEWAHLDIAGPADNEGPAYGFTPKGPTGAIVRTVISMFETLAVKNGEQR